MHLPKLVIFAFLAGIFGGILSPAMAQTPASLATVVNEFKGGGYDEVEGFIQNLAATEDEKALEILDLLEGGWLWNRKADGRLVVATKTDDGYLLKDPLTAEQLGVASKSDLKKIRVNNRIRRALAAARASLDLASDQLVKRKAAAEAIFTSREQSALEIVRKAIANEENEDVKKALEQAEAAIVLESGGEDAEARIAAVEIVKERGDREALSLLMKIAARSDGELNAAVTAAAEEVEARLDRLVLVKNIWFGISLGSVLLLAAIGLAITFGVMGVINMAHGELVMLGAYTTFAVQEIFRASFGGSIEYSLFVAVPAAFIVAGGVGVAIERGVIRFLYGRPLETLLATWGVSLILQQTVRIIFGPSNVEVATPDWMSGTVEIVTGLSLTLNRLTIVFFALMVFLLLALVVRYSSFGLRMRAVTQNRQMAGSVGINANWIDALTFGLGAGVAGIAGVALSQIDNVGPNLGQSYIVDSFLVVVFGGVGNLWGTFVGAMTIGIANKFLEPVAGAVLGKIFILVGVILFIQSRPRGMFPMRGRAAED